MRKRMRWPLLALFVNVVLLRTLLIVFHHATPYERLLNLRSLLLGARPEPAFWAVALADLAAWLGFGWLLYLSLSPPGKARDGARRFLAIYVLATVLAAPFHAATVALAGHLLAFGQLPRYLMTTLLAGCLATVGLLTVPAAAVTSSWRETWKRWLERLPPAGWRFLLLGSAIWLLSQATFFFLALPIGGEFLRALVSTALAWWLFHRAVRWMGETARELAPSRPSWTVPIALGAVTVFLVVLLAGVLSGPGAHDDAITAPPLVVREATLPPTQVTVTAGGALLRSEALTVEVQKDPFDFTVVDRQERTVLEMADVQAGRRAPYGSAALSVEARAMRMLPLLWTGNTIKSRWTLEATAMSQANEIVADQDALIVRGRADRRPVELHFSFVTSETLRIDLETDAGRPWNVTSLSFESKAGEHFVGFGERMNRVDQQGQDVYHLVEENGYGPGVLTPLVRWWLGDRGSFPNGEQCTSWPVPFYLSSQGYGLLLAESYDPRIEVASAYPDVVRVSARDNDLTVYLFAGPTPLSNVEAYTDVTGKPRLPPSWVFLPWKSRAGGPTEPLIREDMEKMRELDIPTSALNIEAWERWRGSFIVDRERYPQVEDLVQEAHENGYKMSFWMFPYVDASTENPVYAQGVRQGYFVRNRVGLPYHFATFSGTEVLVDMTHPGAVSWFQERVAAMYRLGFDAHMNDFGESVPPEGVFYNGRTGFEMRNLYPLLYVRAVDAAVRSVKDDYVIYPRPGFTGMQRFVALQWPGDQNTDWSQSDGLPSAVRAMVSVSMAGLPVHGSDIGGWHDIVSPPTGKELFLRWAELGAYSPWMRAHGGFLHPVREPWRFDDETVAIYRRLAGAHTRLFPYLYTWAHRAVRTGEPIVRHPALLWPEDEAWYAVEDEYLLGNALLVAPVVTQGTEARKVRFPPGEWRHLETGVVYTPGISLVPAPIGQPPVFLRQGELLPAFSQTFDTLEPAADPSIRVGNLEQDLTIYWFAGDAGEMTLFDGTSLRASSQAGRLELEVSGNTERAITWVVYGARPPETILLDGRPLKAEKWSYDPATETLQVLLPRQSSSRLEM